MPSSATSHFLDALAQHRVIAAARGEEGVLRAVSSPVSTVFLLNGSILTLPDMTAFLKAAGKTVFIHIDLCEGLGKDASAVTWCARNCKPDGLISTRSQLLRCASDMGLMTIQRVFLVDSSSLEGGIRHIKAAPPDMIEVLPGLVPKAITRLRDELRLPVIAGGMITQRSDVQTALEAGASAVSVSDEKLWR
ncbi:MAG: glycerol-3-phosphate responsive antiterminator [Clostridia bacterium]|nr:glycerol-3-phosphate responsive antiterminator [Clostridia bacterium]